ncbi:hypothetical protein PIB30_019697 [Stylosanthes scabra]|uniref:Uncharacterized protein n=1 Tax=Stylosanthes scabra TaxID=79078 RepID=A0ABU6U778_9FABA|nr:hypothetical protein [Stylosanthes scabra]
MHPQKFHKSGSQSPSLSLSPKRTPRALVATTTVGDPSECEEYPSGDIIEGGNGHGGLADRRLRGLTSGNDKGGYGESDAYKDEELP